MAGPLSVQVLSGQVSRQEQNSNDPVQDFPIEIEKRGGVFADQASPVSLEVDVSLPAGRTVLLRQWMIAIQASSGLWVRGRGRHGYGRFEKWL